MDITQHLVLAFLEEDNQKLGHFRVRPLLRETGPFTQAETAEWRDDGYIRVVPDKLEQRTFKERMRRLGSFCLLDLREGSADKFRQNKNYSPAKGEKNRFIVYSDVVVAVEKGIYEVISETSLQNAVTPFVFARQGGKIHGPVDRLNGQRSEDDHQLLPDDPRIFSVTLPDESMRLFYWPLPETQEKQAQEERQAEAPVPEEKPEEKNEDMTAIDQIRALDREMLNTMRMQEEGPKEKPKDVLIPDDAGTPLYHAQVETRPAERRRNPLAQAVESTRKAARKVPNDKKAQRGAPAQAKDEAAAEMAAAAVSADVSVDEALEAAWADRANRPGLVGRLLEMEQFKSVLSDQLGVSGDAALGVLRAQLNDLEAERLMTVMNLEKARADEEQYRRSLVDGLVESERAELKKLDLELSGQREALGKLQKQADDIVLARDAALDARRAVTAPQAEDDPTLRELSERLQKTLRARGFEADGNTAAALLTVFALHMDDGFALSAACLTDAEDGVDALCAALGARQAPQSGLFLLAGGSGPVILRPTGERADVAHPMMPVVRAAAEGDISCVPVFPLSVSGGWPETPEKWPAIDAAAFRTKVMKAQKPLTRTMKDTLVRLRGALEERGITLPLRRWAQLSAFIATAQSLLEGGAAAALDFGVVLYVLPEAASGGEDLAFISEISRALPLTLKRLPK